MQYHFLCTILSTKKKTHTTFFCTQKKTNTQTPEMTSNSVKTVKHISKGVQMDKGLIWGIPVIEEPEKAQMLDELKKLIHEHGDLPENGATSPKKTKNNYTFVITCCSVGGSIKVDTKHVNVFFHGLMKYSCDHSNRENNANWLGHLKTMMNKIMSPNKDRFLHDVMASNHLLFNYEFEMIKTNGEERFTEDRIIKSLGDRMICTVLSQWDTYGAGTLSELYDIGVHVNELAVKRPEPKEGDKIEEFLAQAKKVVVQYRDTGEDVGMGEVRKDEEGKNHVKKCVDHYKKEMSSSSFLRDLLKWGVGDIVLIPFVVNGLTRMKQEKNDNPSSTEYIELELARLYINGKLFSKNKLNTEKTLETIKLFPMFLWNVFVNLIKTVYQGINRCVLENEEAPLIESSPFMENYMNCKPVFRIETPNHPFLPFAESSGPSTSKGPKTAFVPCNHERIVKMTIANTINESCEIEMSHPNLLFLTNGSMDNDFNVQLHMTVDIYKEIMTSQWSTTFPEKGKEFQHLLRTSILDAYQNGVKGLADMNTHDLVRWFMFQCVYERNCYGVTCAAMIGDKNTDLFLNVTHIDVFLSLVKLQGLIRIHNQTRLLEMMIDEEKEENNGGVVLNKNKKNKNKNKKKAKKPKKAKSIVPGAPDVALEPTFCIKTETISNPDVNSECGQSEEKSTDTDEDWEMPTSEHVEFMHVDGEDTEEEEEDVYSCLSADEEENDAKIIMQLGAFTSNESFFAHEFRETATTDQPRCEGWTPVNTFTEYNIWRSDGLYKNMASYINNTWLTGKVH